MPYFIEKPEGQFTLIKGDLVVEELPDDIVAAYAVSEKISKTASFTRESLLPKKERRFRCRDGQLRTKSEMSEDDLNFLKEKMARTRAARGQGN